MLLYLLLPGHHRFHKWDSVSWCSEALDLVDAMCVDRCSSFLKQRSMLVFRTPTKDDKTGWQLKTWTIKDWVQIFCSQELIWKSRDFNVYTGDFLLDFMLRWPQVWDAVNLKDDRVSKHCSGVRSQSAGCSAATLPPWRATLPDEMKLIIQ